MPSADQSAPIGPSAEEETAFLSSERENGGPVLVAPSTAAALNADDEKGELPPMEDLVKRIPAQTRDLIEDLFRARFVTVKRIPKAALKN
jgi:type IV secretory pathway protease TraF